MFKRDLIEGDKKSFKRNSSKISGAKKKINEWRENAIESTWNKAEQTEDRIMRW